MFYVLDLDDTLYLERNYVRSGFQVVGRWLNSNFGYAGFYHQAWKLFENGIRGNIFDQVLAMENIVRPNLVKKLVDIYRKHDPIISLTQDSIDFLKQHKENSLAIITDGYSVTQWKKIEALDIKRYVSHIIVTGDWGKKYWKPHSRAFFEAMQGRTARECQYIADNPRKDFIAPEKIGWAPSIRIKRLGGLHYNLHTPDTAIEISSFNELPV